jgi:hypothetical protein
LIYNWVIHGHAEILYRLGRNYDFSKLPDMKISLRTALSDVTLSGQPSLDWTLADLSALTGRQAAAAS